MKPRERQDPAPLPSPPEEHDPLDAIDDSGLGIPDDRILGEISHEMGNYFHKLYYWAEYLRDRNGHGAEADRTAFDMLEGTVERLEHFMRMILEYFAPARLSFTRLRADDLVGGLGSRLVGRRLRIDGDPDVRATAVLADAALIGNALRTIFECAAATLIDEDEMVVRVSASRRREFHGIEIDFEAGRGARAAKTLARGIEIAVAEKFIQMHGGELFERKGADSCARALVVFLPIYA